MKFHSQLVEEAPSAEDLQAFKRLCVRKWGEVGADMEGSGKRTDWADVVLDRLAANLRKGTPERELFDRVSASMGSQKNLTNLVAKWL